MTNIKIPVGGLRLFTAVMDGIKGRGREEGKMYEYVHLGHIVRPFALRDRRRHYRSIFIHLRSHFSV